MPWTLADIPDLRGRTVVVTGANSGLGFETAAALAAAGATTVLACRNLEKAKVAAVEIETRSPGATVELVQLDLSDQAQIASASAEALERFPRIDRLVNNAGVMGLPLQHTADGHEVVFGTNHLGHFAWTLRVLPSLLATPGSRVVTVSSLSARLGRIRWDDLKVEHRRYNKSAAYAQSKLANLLFALGLQRRLVLAGAATASLAAHPGSADTEIARNQMERASLQAVRERIGHLVTQPTADAAWPSLRAATDPGAYGGEYYGPSEQLGFRGAPVAGTWPKRALDEDDQVRLWDRSVDLTGVDLRV